MTQETCYENFRTVLTMNLASVITDSETIKNVLSMVDINNQLHMEHQKAFS